MRLIGTSTKFMTFSQCRKLKFYHYQVNIVCHNTTPVQLTTRRSDDEIWGIQFISINSTSNQLNACFMRLIIRVSWSWCTSVLSSAEKLALNFIRTDWFEVKWVRYIRFVDKKRSRVVKWWCADHETAAKKQERPRPHTNSNPTEKEHSLSVEINKLFAVIKFRLGVRALSVDWGRESAFCCFIQRLNHAIFMFAVITFDGFWLTTRTTRAPALACSWALNFFFIAVCAVLISKLGTRASVSSVLKTLKMKRHDRSNMKSDLNSKKLLILLFPLTGGIY